MVIETVGSKKGKYLVPGSWLEVYQSLSLESPGEDEFTDTFANFGTVLRQQGAHGFMWEVGGWWDIIGFMFQKRNCEMSSMIVP